MERFYPIGTPGTPWTATEKAAWLATQSAKRSYAEEVLAKLEDIGGAFEVGQYGDLPTDPQRYPLRYVRPRKVGAGKPWVLITGGVHGYETSGVQGALAFVSGRAAKYAERVNIVVAPCVSPWGYEMINRWNPDAVDPNRSFVEDCPAQEAAALQHLVGSIQEEHGIEFAMHLDLHETTDSDETEFRPALAARDGEAYAPGTIPDGFYTVADTPNPQPEFQRAIIVAVEAVTHIAPPDANGQIIGADVTQPGVIHYPFKDLGLCASVTGARYTTTTEVYPDSPRATPEICNAAQVAAVVGALEYLLG